MRLAIQLIFVAALALILMSCETIKTPTEINGCCVIFDALKPSNSDTQETIDWMIEHNAVYEDLC